MAYGRLPGHQVGHQVGHCRTGVALLAVGLLLVLSAGWVEQNSHSFNSKADTTLCHLLDDRC